MQHPTKKEPSSPFPVKSVLIDGTPYVDCGWCQDIVRLVEAEKQPITILIRWEHEDEYYREFGVLTVGTKSKPVLRSALGCFTCWNNQQQEKVRYGSHFYGQVEDNRSYRPVKIDPPIQHLTTEYFKGADNKMYQRTMGKTIYRKKEDQYKVVRSGAVNTYSEGDISTLRRMRDHDRRSTDKVHKEYGGLYGPYNDRKGDE